MKYIDPDDLEEGKIYAGWLNPGQIIFIPNECELYSNRSNNGGKPHSFSSINYPSNVANIREATASEQEWLIRCISVGKFVKQETINNYEVY